MLSERSQIKMVFDSIYIEFKTKQNESTGLEVRKVFVLGDEAVSSEEDTAGRKPLNTGVWQAVTLTELGSQGRGGRTRDLLKA